MTEAEMVAVLLLHVAAAEQHRLDRISERDDVAGIRRANGVSGIGGADADSASLEEGTLGGGEFR